MCVIYTKMEKSLFLHTSKSSKNGRHLITSNIYDKNNGIVWLERTRDKTWRKIKKQVIKF